MKKVIVLLILILTGCSSKSVFVEPIKLNCKTISLMQYEDLKLQDYCQLPVDSTITLDGEFNTQDIGTHSLSYILSSKDKNDFSIGTIEYEITKYIPNCPKNSSVFEDEEGNVICKCDEDYVDMTSEQDKGEVEKTVCELKAVCETGYDYDAKTNTCIKKQSKPVSNNSGASSTPANNENSGSDDNSGTYTPSPSPEPNPTPQPTPTPTPSPSPDPAPSSSGSQTCSPNGNSQSALDSAYSQCVSVCNAHGNCSVYWNGSAYVAEWN